MGGRRGQKEIAKKRVIYYNNYNKETYCAGGARQKDGGWI
jgi:hypothetical protein